jgi:hypothetical protein
MKKQIRLYNMAFPIWLMFVWPTYLWLLIIPANFIIDSLVLYGSSRHQQLPDRFGLWRKHILPIWLIGFFSDFIGAGLVFLVYLILANYPGIPNLILFPGTTLVSIPGLIVSGVLIYVLNRIFTFHNSDLEPAQIHKLCLHLAIFTAPYAFLIPIYG